jgi:hypothetical protein
MSHFTVLVIGDDPEEQLAPFHEFECTGNDDQYVQDIDETAELWEKYNKETSTCLRDSEGKLHSFFDEDGNWKEKFSIPDTRDSFGHRRTYFTPNGYEKVDVPTPQIQSFTDFIEGWSGQTVVPFGKSPDLEKEHKYGYVLVDEAGNVTKVIDRTNPNKKWDWYQLGGRWTGFFQLKQGTRGKTGKPGFMTPQAEVGFADQARKRDIDFEAMRNEAAETAREDYRDFHLLIGDLPKPESWSTIRDRYEPDYATARNVYGEQIVVRLLQNSEKFRWEDNPERYFVTEDEFAQSARDSAISTFAVLKDGQWYERGSMGWWGCVSDEKEQGNWDREFSKLLDEVDNNTLLSVYDCHI